MKLVIVSHTEHYRQDSDIVGWGATIREIDHLACLFDQVVHVAPLHSNYAPESAIPYQSSRVELVPVPPAGGHSLMSKLEILIRAPLYLRIMRRELRDADVVHVRCPANISLLAIVLLAFVRHPRVRWIKYAGNWAPTGREAWSYKFQRWWLRHNLSRGVVTVNGEWPEQPQHVFSFLNPCLTGAEVEAGRAIAAGKVLRQPVRLIFVGRVEHAKGIGRALDIVRELCASGVSLSFDVVGDGPEREEFEQYAAEVGIGDVVRFHGALPRTTLPDLYAGAHFVLLPSSGEGWPKVLSEAMAYGAVPLASRVGSIPHYLETFGTGRAMASDNPGAFVDAIQWYIDHPEQWKVESMKSVQTAAAFSYSEYLRSVRDLLRVAGLAGGRPA